MKKTDFTQGGKDGFVYIPKGVLKSKNISLKALGVYFMIVSLPDDWNFSVKGLCTLCSDGYGSVTTAVEELEKAGFLQRTAPNGGANRFSDGEWTVRDFPDPKKTSRKNPDSKMPCRENQPQLNNKQINNKQPNNKEQSNISEENQRIVDVWNAAGLTEIKEIRAGSNRYKMLGARLKEYGEDKIIEAIEKAKASPFLTGRNNKGWAITFDWFLKPNNFIKVLEGNYDGREKQTSPPVSFTPAPAKSSPQNKPSYDIEAFKKQALADNLVYVKRTG